MDKLQNELFIIPTSFRKGYIIYAPLKKCAFWVNDEYGEQCKTFLEEGIPLSEKYTDLKNQLSILLNKPSILINSKPNSCIFQQRIIFILSQRCNLDCSYCYAKDAHSDSIISWDKVCTVIDLVLNNNDNHIYEITFIGGGEPMMTWTLLKNTVMYAEHQAASKGKKVRFSMTTNATLLNDERAEWLAKHNFRISISFEILPEIQNEQRCFPNKVGSFKSVDEGIRILLNHGIVPSFRATITQLNVKKMEDMVHFTIDHYPEVKNLHFEHVSDNTFNQKEYYEDYIKNFLNAFKTAQKNNINLKNSITHSMNYVRSTFCRKEFCVTPTGDIVSCHRVSSNKEDLFTKFQYSYIDEKKGILQQCEAMQQSIQLLDNKCNSCFARWHCAGGCRYNRLIYSPNQIQLLCDFTRKLILQCLENIFLEIK